MGPSSLPCLLHHAPEQVLALCHRKQGSTREVEVQGEVQVSWGTSSEPLDFAVLLDHIEGKLDLLALLHHPFFPFTVQKKEKKRQKRKRI